MGDTQHPLDRAVDGLYDTRELLVHALASDGISEEDQQALQAFDEQRSEVSIYRIREVAAEAYKRNGPTRYVAALFADAKVGIVDLTVERKRRRSGLIDVTSPEQTCG